MGRSDAFLEFLLEGEAEERRGALGFELIVPLMVIGFEHRDGAQGCAQAGVGAEAPGRGWWRPLAREKSAHWRDGRPTALDLGIAQRAKGWR